MTTKVPAPAHTDLPHAKLEPLERHWLLVCMAAFACLYMAFYPPIYTSLDESVYMNMAYVLRQGTVYADKVGINIIINYPVGPHMVSKYPLGWPAFIALISLLGWKAALGTNLLVHLLTFWLVANLLRKLGVPRLFALLYLLHPTAVLYSRTAMADPVSGLLLTLAFAALLDRSWVACGMALGLAALARTGNIIALPILLASAAWELSRLPDSDWRQVLRSIALTLAGASPFLLLALYYARVIAGGEMGAHTGTFSAANFPQMFPGYLLMLLCLYPGMLLSLAWYRGPCRAAMVALPVAFLLIYSFWYYRDQGGSPLETLIVGQRYFLAVLPLLIVAYSSALWHWLRDWPPKIQKGIVLAAVTILFCAAGAIMFKHQHYLDKLAAARDGMLRIVAPSDVLICNTQLGKLFHPGWGTRQIWIAKAGDAVNGGAQAQSLLETALKQGKRVYLAAWARAERADDMPSANAVVELSRHLGAVALPAQEKQGLPIDIVVYVLYKPVRLGHSDPPPAAKQPDKLK